MIVRLALQTDRREPLVELLAEKGGGLKLVAVTREPEQELGAPAESARLSSSVMNPPLSIVADDRERPSGVVDLLQEMPGVDLAVRRLPLGDFEIAGKALVERKTAEDFASSIVDGRLFRQSIRLANAAKPCALILEGSGKAFSTLGMRREALQGALISLSLVFAIPVLRSIGPEETARLLVYSAEQLARAHSSYRPSRRIGRSEDARRLQVLCALPGVGRGRAQALLRAFGSLEKCLAASREDLARIPGIGLHTADAIRALVSEAPAPYRSSEPARLETSENLVDTKTRENSEGLPKAPTLSVG